MSAALTLSPKDETTHNDTVTTTPEPVVLDPAAPFAMMVDPARLEVGENVRVDFDLDDEPSFTASVQEHGVRIPITAVRTRDGRFVVTDGQLRTLTAQALNLDTVPVWVTHTEVDIDDRRWRASNTLGQITVNDRRIGLTDADRAAGITLALDLGTSVTKVGKALQLKRDQVKQLGKVGSSTAARQVLDTGQLDLEQAALLADYDGVGDTDAVQRLLDAPPYRFAYTAARIAEDRAEQRARLAAARPYAEAGFGILLDHATGLVPASDVVDSDGRPATVERLHANPTGWLVHCEPTDELLIVDRATGDRVEHDEVDWDTEGNSEAAPAEGMRHADSIEARTDWRVDYLLPAELVGESGWHSPPSPEPEHTPDSGDDPDSRGATAPEAAADHAREQEQQRYARRQVRELNKQGAAAKTARIEFVTTLLARKTLPGEAARFIADSLVREPSLLGGYKADLCARELLGVTGGRDTLSEMLVTAKPARCQVITLALVLGAHEQRVEKDCWRWTVSGTRRYLAFLRDLGHSLTPVELAAAGELDYHDIDLDTGPDIEATGQE
ncbi:ParB/RepB/Spo0J family partition protein [Nocardia sputi]|uniref:ParB/RepB/Spo0J family partition protein n=1 Tax=Nocardia sputi TaxID=2943705 RepID=UPI0020BFE03A|nr:ParB/RepB/Spo0J family partition protein [Nocardia sputi]